MSQPTSDLLGQVHVAVIRLDAKFDNINTELRRISDESLRNHVDHETRLRVLEVRPYVTVDQFTKLEQRPHIAPATVWKFIGAIFAFSSVVIAVVNILIK